MSHSPSALVNFLIRFAKRSDVASKTPKDYGIGQLLFSSDIHLLMLIDNNPDFNQTQLANIVGVSKMSISALSRKLVKKGMLSSVEKKNKKDVFYELTPIAKTALQNHAAYHVNQSSYMEGRLAAYTEEDIALVMRLLSDYISYLEEYIVDGTKL